MNERQRPKGLGVYGTYWRDVDYHTVYTAKCRIISLCIINRQHYSFDVYTQNGYRCMEIIYRVDTGVCAL